MVSIACAAMAKTRKPAKNKAVKKTRGAKKPAAPKRAAAKTAAKKATPKKAALKRGTQANRLAPPRVRSKRQLRPAPMRPRQRPRSAYDELPRTPANFQPLTPLTLLERAAAVFPDHIAVIHGKQRTNYAAFYRRCRQ